MISKKLVSIFILILVMCISAPHAVRAGGPSPTTTGATVRGSVRVEGKVPAGKGISMAAHPVCAKQHPSPLVAQEEMADAKGGLQNAIEFVSGGVGGPTVARSPQ